LFGGIQLIFATLATVKSSFFLEMVLTETSSVTSASTASSSSSANSDATTTDKKHFRFEANKVKGFRNKWREQWSPAIQKSLVALAKDTDNNVMPLLGLLIETVQIVAFAFTNINW
jgi:hypothetical protein